MPAVRITPSGRRRPPMPRQAGSQGECRTSNRAALFFLGCDDAATKAFFAAIDDDRLTWGDSAL